MCQKSFENDLTKSTKNKSNQLQVQKNILEKKKNFPFANKVKNLEEG